MYRLDPDYSKFKHIVLAYIDVHHQVIVTVSLTDHIKKTPFFFSESQNLCDWMTNGGIAPDGLSLDEAGPTVRCYNLVLVASSDTSGLVYRFSKHTC